MNLIDGGTAEDALERNGPFKEDRLIELAQGMGFVVTIELKPIKPLAMGHYQMVADIRPARERA